MHRESTAALALIGNVGSTHPATRILAMQKVFKLAQKRFKNRNFRASMLIIFLEIGAHEAVLYESLEYAADVLQETVSRMVVKLSQGDIHADGLGLVESIKAPNMPRKKMARLTPKGRQLYDEMQALLAAAN